MAIPILRQGRLLITALQGAVSDLDFRLLGDQLAARVGAEKCDGVILDVSSLPLVDSFAARILRTIVETVRLRGARAIIVGIQPEVAIAMVHLGLSMDWVETALDLDEGLARLAAKKARHGQR